MRSRVPAVALMGAVMLFSISVATAQTVPAPNSGAPARAPLKNLQVFPKDIARPQLLANMKFFSQSLGVRCTFCHVGVEGQPPSTYDFASDAKKEKLTARRMLAMVHRINQQDFGVTDFSNAKVTCFTCHRGSQRPLTSPPAQPPGAAPAAIPIPPPPPRTSERGNS